MADDIDNLLDAGLTEDIPVMSGGKKQLLKGSSVVSAPEPAAPVVQSVEQAEEDAVPAVEERVGDLESQYEADAKEIQEIKEERMPERIDVEQTRKTEESVEDLVDGILTGGAVTVKDEDMSRRFRSMLEAFFRGIRDSLETKSKMTMPKNSGGLGMREEDAEKLVALLARKKAGFEGKFEGRLKGERQAFVAERAQRQLNETEERDQKEKDDLDQRFMGLTGEGPNITVEEKVPAVPTEPKIIPISDGKAEGATEEVVPQQGEEQSTEPEPKPEPIAEPEPKPSPKPVPETEPVPETKPDEPAKEDSDSSFLDMLDSDLKEDEPAPVEDRPATQPPPDLPVAGASAETGVGGMAPESAVEEPKAEPVEEPELLPEEKPIPEPPEPLPVPEPPAPTPAPEPPTPAPAPEPPKPQAAQPPPIAPAAPGKPVMSDVISSAPRLTGPIEELGALTVKDFRRLSKKPEEATLKIKDKIDALEEQSFEHKTAGIQAWRESPANKLYLEMLRRSLEGVPVREVIASAESKGEDIFSKEEFDSIMALNRTLRFG